MESPEKILQYILYSTISYYRERSTDRSRPSKRKTLKDWPCSKTRLIFFNFPQKKTLLHRTEIFFSSKLQTFFHFFGPVLVMTCRLPAPLPLKSSQIGIKDARCTKTYENKILRFLRNGRFCTQSSWKIDRNITVSRQIFFPKDAQCSETHTTCFLPILAIYIF